MMRGSMSQIVKNYSIPLIPISWQRVKHNGRQLFDGQKEQKVMYGIYMQQGHGDSPPFIEAVSLDVIFYMKKPTGKRKAFEQFWHSTYPDIDNLLKILFDSAVDARILKDDRLISKLSTQKIYDDNPRIDVIIKTLGDK